MKSKDFKHARKILVFNSKIKGENKKFNYSVIITTIINMYYLHHAFKTIIQKNQNALVKWKIIHIISFLYIIQLYLFCFVTNKHNIICHNILSILHRILSNNSIRNVYPI